MQKAIQYIKNELKGIYSADEIQSLTYLLLSNITGYTKIEIIVNKNTNFSDVQRAMLNSFVNKLKIHTPIQYIIGKTEFYGLPFLVSDAVLIPRPETEELIEWIIETSDKNTEVNILDIGTGSGCIAVTLAQQFSKAKVTAFDISEVALEVATQNAELNKVKVNFLKVDILNANNYIGSDSQWEIIVSNPPYVPNCEQAEIQPNVLDHEPHIALFVPDADPLIFYRKIMEFALNHLNPGGYLFFETHRDWAKEIVKLLVNNEFCNVQLRKDLSGNDRMIKAQKASNLL